MKTILIKVCEKSGKFIDYNIVNTKKQANDYIKKMSKNFIVKIEKTGGK